MKNLFLFIVAFTIGVKSNLVNAQAFKEGDNMLSVGYGFGVIDVQSDITELSGNYDDESLIGPIYVKYEHALTDRITMGINVAYGNYKYTETDLNFYNQLVYNTTTYETYSIMARLNWHFGHIPKFDPYWGLGLGYRAATTSYSSSDPSYNTDQNSNSNFPLGFELTIGARYYLTDKVAIYMETGIAKSVVQAGLTFKLK